LSPKVREKHEPETEGDLRPNSASNLERQKPLNAPSDDKAACMHGHAEQAISHKIV